MTTFIHLPQKRTESFDWKSTLTTFLTSTFGRSFTEELTPSITRLDKLRTSIQHINYNEGNVAIPLHIDYINQLTSLTLRLPMELVITTPFNWSDTFTDTHKFTTQNSVSFEKASLLFNLAALYSHTGLIAAAGVDWKTAINEFASAAAVFAYLSTQFVHAPTTDLHVHTTSGIQQVFLGQASECFLWNYMQSTGVKHSLAARLSDGVSNCFHLASEHLTDSESPDWIRVHDIKFKELYFHAFALFQYAQSYVDTTKIGYAVAVGQMAKASIVEAKKVYSSKKGKIEFGLFELLVELEKEVDTKLKEWEKDNDLIYHDAVPDKNNVPTIKAMIGVKSIDFESILKSNSSPNTDLFAKIVPMEAHQGMSVYSEKQAEIVRRYNEEVDVANEQVKSFLEFSKLPGSVIEIQSLLKPSNESVEEEEREKQQEYPRVLAMAHEIETSLEQDFVKESQKVKQKRDFISGNLDTVEEEFVEDDKNMLVKGLGENRDLEKIKGEVINVRRVLAEAGASDNKLQELWSKFETEINVLKNGTEGVQKWLSNDEAESLTKAVSLLDLDDNSSDEADKILANELIDNVYSTKRSLEILISERNSTLFGLKTVMHEEDISSVLIKYNGVSQSQLNKVFDEQLQKYNSYTSRLDALINVQDEKILELKDSLSRLLDLSIVRKKLEEKKKNCGTVKSKLNRLINAYETWKLCTKGIREALTFYTSLNERTTTITRRTHDIVKSRSNNTQSRVNSVSTGGFGGYTMNATSYAPSYPNEYQSASNTSFYQTQQQQPPPRYSSDSSAAPPVPTKPNAAGNQPYSTPSVYDPNMYSQFGQNWKTQ